MIFLAQMLTIVREYKDPFRRRHNLETDLLDHQSNKMIFEKKKFNTLDFLIYLIRPSPIFKQINLRNNEILDLK